MSEEQIQSLIARYAALYPDPLITSAQAAAIAGVAVGTIHNWSSLGKLGGVATNAGRLRIDRDAFVRRLATGDLQRDRVSGCGGSGGAGRRARPVPVNVDNLP